MASPQIENGFLKLANEIVEALARTNLSAYQSRVLWVIFRKTYGFGKKEDWISNSQIVELTGLHKAHISRTVRDLADRNIVTKRGNKIGFQKDYQQWRELPKGVTCHHELPGGVTPLPKGVTKVTKGGTHNKRYFTKDIERDSQKPNPGIKDFLVYWDQAFREKTGKDYFFNEGKEGSLTKKMLKPYSLDRLKELARVFFKSQDQFFQNSGYTIGFFYSQLNKVVIEADRKKGW